MALHKMQHGHIGGTIRSILRKQIENSSEQYVQSSLEKLSELNLIVIKQSEKNGFPSVVHLTELGVYVHEKIMSEGEIPAADRLVALNHNSKEYKNAVSALDSAIQEIESTNYYPPPDDKNEVIEKLKEGRNLLSQAHVVVKKIDEYILQVLKFLEVRAIAVAKVAAAIYAVKMLIVI